jgi:competence protein ComEC
MLSYGPEQRRSRVGVLALPARLRRVVHFAQPLSASLPDWGGRLRQALETEIERRRLFNWLPVCMGAGVLLYFLADRCCAGSLRC